MNHFRPLRASPPPRTSAESSSRASDFRGDSPAPTTIAPELAALSAEEIEFIEEVISRAPSTASTFLTVFKAYNDVLQERGLDPQNEVVYYGKLLKIGTLKGKSWADKWRMVKEEQGYVSKSGTNTRGGRTTRVTRTPAKSTPRVPSRLPQNSTEPDTFTLHSHQDDTDQTEEDRRPIQTTAGRRPPYTALQDDTPRPPRRFGTPSSLASNNSLGLDIGPPPTTADAGNALHRLATRARKAVTPRWDTETAVETTTQVSSIPPSYGAAVRDDLPLLQDKGKAPAYARKAPVIEPSTLLPPTLKPSPVPPVALPRRSRDDGDDDEPKDPFERIRYANNVKLADQFRNDRLVERCYEVWKQGYEWIVTTGEQIAEARDSLILRRALQQWRRRTAGRLELYLRVAALSNRRCLKRILQVWKLKAKEKKQLHWREDMRSRMKAVREQGELRLKKDMWAKWRQSYLSHLSEQQFARRVMQRFFRRWKSKLKRLDELEAAADHFVYAHEEKGLDHAWITWRHTTELRRAEKTMKERVDLRIMAHTLDIWRQNHYLNHVAQRNHDALVLKHMFNQWKAAQSRTQACFSHLLEHRAVKYLSRRDDVLVRAVMRIWKAHERGRLLTRVRALRLLRQAWAIWKRRMEEQKEREEMAQLFRARSSSILATSVLKKWCGVRQSHQNARSFAVHYHRAQLQYKMLLAWRLQLRAKLRTVKQAKAAQKHLLLRRYFRTWAAKVEEQRRTRKLRAFELRTTKTYFLQWLERARQQRGIKLAEEIITQRVAMRIMEEALRRWTTRVADSKFRELETTHRYERALVLHSYHRWKALCKRHVDDLSLMESYQDIKREENIKKMFYRWLASAKKARHRRLQLRAKEEEFKLTIIAGAWDKWRERFQDIRLQPMGDAFIKQHQRDLLLRAYGVWHSKSLSFPAVRFHTSNVKTRYWKKWRDLMPRAMQAKEAREMDRRNTLKKAFAHWRKAQQTKIDLKAINYARYLELLSSAPRQPPQPQRGTALVPRGRTIFPPRRTRPPSPAEGRTSDLAPAAAPSRPAFALSRPTPNPARVGIASLLAHTARTASPERRARSPERPKFSSRRTATATARAPSPSDTEPEPAPAISAWRKGVRPLPPRSAPPSVVGDAAATMTTITAAASTAGGAAAGRGRSGSLWEELKQVRRRSRAPTERTYSPEPM